MIHYNADHKLSFEGYLVKGVRPSFMNLSHFLICEKFFNFNEDYYLHLSNLKLLDDVKTEAAQYSNEDIEQQFTKMYHRILLTGVHFCISQNKSYFNGYDSLEEDVYCADILINNIINNYRKRYITARNTQRLFLYSDHDWESHEDGLKGYVHDFLNNDLPEEVYIEKDSNFSSVIEKLIHPMYLPITICTREEVFNSNFPVHSLRIDIKGLDNSTSIDANPSEVIEI
jgi:hypothetical protein